MRRRKLGRAMYKLRGLFHRVQDPGAETEEDSRKIERLRQVRRDYSSDTWCWRSFDRADTLRDTVVTVAKRFPSIRRHWTHPEAMVHEAPKFTTLKMEPLIRPCQRRKRRNKLRTTPLMPSS